MPGMHINSTKKGSVAPVRRAALRRASGTAVQQTDGELFPVRNYTAEVSIWMPG
jgi:hypothetical protein